MLRYLESEGFNVHRNALSGALDCGDLTVSMWEGKLIIEVKNEKRMALAEYVDEAETEALNAKANFGVVWHKRRGKGQAADHYVTMSGKTFIKILELVDFAFREG